jgi:glycosyltransferase involved in cell wall biosynthesis
MRLLWISGREIESDLAGTTEKSLTKELVDLGHELSFVSPGKSPHDSAEHFQVSTIKLPGLVTLSGARSIKKFLGEIDLSDYDIVLIDWRYVLPLQKVIRSLQIPWCVIDRGPPATSGIFGGKIRRELLRNIQKKFWERAWKIAEECASIGFVVSKRHETLVRGFAPKLSISHIPAGSYPLEIDMQKSDPSEILRLAYVGRIDRKRGVSSILKLSEKLDFRGVNHFISIAGDGNLKREMERTAMGSDRIAFLGTLSRKEVEELLSNQHVGIMPMPNIPVWSISSPLKLAEYLSCGLAVIGPDHPGNTIDGAEEWSMLTSSEPWFEAAAEDLSSRISEDWGSITNSAIRSSEILSWKNIGEAFEKELRKIIDNY